MNDEPKKRGRPRKNQPVYEDDTNLGPPIVKDPDFENPHYFEQDMQDFFQRDSYRLQRYFIAAGERAKAERIAVRMVEWFREKLASIMPEF